MEPRKGMVVKIKSGDESINAYLAVPEKKGKHPAIIVIHEWWGMNDWVAEQADLLSKAGYVALAVDLYRGKVATEPEMAHELSRALPEDRALRDLKAAFEYLRKHTSVHANKIGSIGWCMGGGLSLNLAVNEPRLKACVIYYGRLMTDENMLKRLNCPVLGNFGDQDRGIPVADVRAFEEKLKKLGKKVEIHIFAGAGHAFANRNNTRGYHADAAKKAWDFTIKFLTRSLG
jgi:carboxymethylenebutenolidase